MAAPGVLEPAAQSAERARFDAFVSYRRVTADTEFVDQLQRDLADRGKRVWVDRAEIEPASDWSQRVRRGIDASKAFVYVLTPESAVSPECLRELEAAVELHKLVVPVVLRDVDPKILPEALTKPNWVYFSPGHDPGRGLDELIQALEEDLSWRDEHTRLGVRTKEWEDSERDKSFLLRGSDLRTGEEWLGTAAAHPRTPPTAGQAAFIVASRKAAVRAQRTWRAALSAGLVVALALAAVAFVQRDQARHEAQLADSRAFAADATADLSSNPQQSLRLALNATTINAGGPGAAGAPPGGRRRPTADGDPVRRRRGHRGGVEPGHEPEPDGRDRAAGHGRAVEHDHRQGDAGAGRGARFFWLGRRNGTGIRR